MTYDNDGPIYSMLNGKPCTPCAYPTDVFVWIYQNYATLAACEAVEGRPTCCTCIDPG